jgi:2-keto-4-pentenoate hydratase/2-oxohepta-3-ene-1,7-dioic acid hydratase in catechol pathway
MIFSVAKTMEILSEIMTLNPGDMIAMGTPQGVGHARKPQLWLKPGDRIAVEIEGIGTLENPVVAA